jgi:hypothetical protein
MTGMKIVTRSDVAKGHVQVGVHVDPTRQQMKPGRVDHVRARRFEISSYCYDLLAVYKHVCSQQRRITDHRAAAKQKGHSGL